MMAQRLTRRGVVNGLGLAPLVGVVVPHAAFAVTPPQDPLPGLLADQQRFLAAWTHEVDTDPAAGNFGTPRCLVLEGRQLAAERALCTTPARTIAGLAAQIEYAQSEFGDSIKHGWSEPYASIFDTLVAGVSALAQTHSVDRVGL